jgi:hypothetical protein
MADEALGRAERAAKEDVTVGVFRPEDAQGIADLFRAVYGESYPVQLFYHPEELTRANLEERYYSFTARTKSGKVVGAVNLFRSAPFKSVYELGSGLVLKEFRGRGLNARIFNFVIDGFLPTCGAVEELFGEPVCNHTTTQKQVVAFHLVETALEAALMPAEAYRVERSAPGRVAAVLAFRSYKPKPQVVFVPPCYEEEFRFLYDAIDDRRDVAKGNTAPPRPEVTNAAMEIFDFARVARIAVHEVGKDFASRIDRLLAACVEKGVLVVQVWLGLNVPEIAYPVDELRSRGFFLGGALPRWFDHDGMLMQKLYCAPCFEDIRLYTDRSKAVLELVKRDYRRIGPVGK